MTLEWQCKKQQQLHAYAKAFTVCCEIVFMMCNRWCKCWTSNLDICELDLRNAAKWRRKLACQQIANNSLTSALHALTVNWPLYVFYNTNIWERCNTAQQLHTVDECQVQMCLLCTFLSCGFVVYETQFLTCATCTCQHMYICGGCSFNFFFFFCLPLKCTDVNATVMNPRQVTPSFHFMIHVLFYANLDQQIIP